MVNNFFRGYETHKEKTQAILKEYKSRVFFNETHQYVEIENGAGIDHRAKANFRYAGGYGFNRGIRDLTSTNHAGLYPMGSGHVPQNYYFSSGMNDQDGYSNYRYEWEMREEILERRVNGLQKEIEMLHHYIRELEQKLYPQNFLDKKFNQKPL